MSPIVEFLRHFDELTRKRVFGITVLLAIVWGCLAIAERQSGWISLSRLERAQQLLNEIAAREEAGFVTEESRAVQEQIRQRLVVELHGPRSIVGVVRDGLSGTGGELLLRFLTAAWSWYALAFVGLLLPKSERRMRWTAFGTLIVFGSIVGCAFLLVPPFQPTWVRYGLLPFAVFLLTAGLIMVNVGVSFFTRHAKIRNNLRQLSAAFDQFVLENGVTEARYEQIVGDGPKAYLRSLESIAGEDYRSVKLRTDAVAFEVRTADGLVVSIPR